MVISKILIVLLLFYLEKEVSTLHTSFCIRFPSDSKLDPTYGKTGQSDVATVGVEKFPSNIWKKYLFTLEDGFDGGSAADLSHSFAATAQTGLSLDVHAIRGRTEGDDPLVGWLRIEVGLPLEEGFSDLVRSFVLYATDEQQNFVGTFEHNVFSNDNQDCPPSDATKYMILPCGGVGKHEPFASNVVLYVRNNSVRGPQFPTKYKQYWPIVPDFKERFKLNFYYRYSIQTFNKNKDAAIIIRIIVDPDHKFKKDQILGTIEKYEHYLVSATAYFSIRKGAIPGAADPLSSDRLTLSCNQAVETLTGRAELEKNYDPTKFFGGIYLQKNWHWYFEKFSSNQKFELAAPDSQFINPQTGLPSLFAFAVYTKTGCSAKYFGGRCDSSLCSKLAERFTNSERNRASFDLIPQVRSASNSKCQCANLFAHNMCYNEAPETPDKFNRKATTFHDCKAHYQSQVQGDRCKMTKDEAEKVVIKVIRWRPRNYTIITYEEENRTHVVIGDKSGKTNNNIKELVDRRGVRAFAFGTVLYTVRKGHAVLMILMAMFCAPVSMFVSRYYKESFMNSRILYTRVWLQIHLQLLFWMFALFVAGLLMAGIGRQFLGISLLKLGLYHRVSGWITAFIFLLLVLTGGIRLYDDPGRSWTIGLHWFLGYSFYVLNVISVLTSIDIPGSPIANEDMSTSGTDTNQQIHYVIAFWLIFELVVQVSMNVLLRLYDRWMQVQKSRIYIPLLIGVPIPVLKENSSSDASGDGIRLIVFFTYIGVAALWTIFAILICVQSESTFDKNKGFGPMRCTHQINDSLTGNWYKDYGPYELKKHVDPECMYW